MTESLLIRKSVVVDGCEVSYLVGGDGQTLVLVHGGSAHAGWWTWVAEILATRFRVVVPDLSGHGQSCHRQIYVPSVWVGDVEGSVQASGATKAFVVGHSMGGAVGVYLAASRPEMVDGLVLVDTALPPRAVDAPGLQSRRRSHSVYATREAILERFRLLPVGSIATERILSELAEESIVSTADGWTWRYDPHVRQRFTEEGLGQQIRHVKCPVAYLAGELSTVSDAATVQYLEEQLGREVAYAVVPNAYHHVPLDSPALCAAAIEGFIEAWVDATY